jgi:hypothetical protein
VREGEREREKESVRKGLLLARRGNKDGEKIKEK